MAAIWRWLWTLVGASMVAAFMVYLGTPAEPPERFPSWAERGFPTKASSFPIPPPEARGFVPAPPPPKETGRYTICGIAGAENCWRTP